MHFEVVFKVALAECFFLLLLLMLLLLLLFAVVFVDVTL